MADLTLISRRRLLASGLTSTGGFFVATAFPRMALAKSIAGHGASMAQPAFKPSAYVEIAADGQVTFVIGKSEMGQGTLTGIAQLIADELACDWDSLRIVQADADKAFGFPHNGFMATGGSTGLRSEWKRMRTVGAAARIMLQQAAADKWSIDVGQTAVSRGIVQGPNGRSAAFGELAPLAAQLRVPAKPTLKSKQQRTFIGRTVKRLDTVLKTTGQAEYGIDVNVEGMLTAVIVQPPTLMAPVKSFDGSKALARPGVSAVLKTSTGVAIVGEHYWAVHSARDDVAVDWGPGPFDTLGTQAITDSYRTALGQNGQTAEKKGNTSLPSNGRTVSREVVQPLLAHACMEPMNFTVSVGPDGAEAWGPTQAQSKVQQVVAKVAGIKPSDVKVHTTFLGGGFGRRSAIDFVQAAAEISKVVGRPVKLVYSREDDMRAGRYRPFTVARASGTLDAHGDLAALNVKVAAPSVSRRSGFPFLVRKDGLDPHAVTGFTGLAYDIPNINVEWVDHDLGLPVHFWRAVGASHNPFVLETLIDELAKEAGKDPLAFRRRLLRNSPRHLFVLDQLAKFSGWEKRAPADLGRGIAIVESFETIVAQLVELRIVDQQPKIERVYCVVDCGVAINPGLVTAQMESSIVFGLSAFLRGRISMEDGQIEQSNFHDYEPLRISEMPKIDVRIVNGAEKPGGVGEPGLPPILPAVANAMFALNGTRIEELPYVSAS